MNPIAMRPVRIARVDVIGILWQGSKGCTSYNLSDADLSKIGEVLTRDGMRKFLKGGDFQSIVDFRVVVGEEELDWQTEDSEELFDRYLDHMYGG